MLNTPMIFSGLGFLTEPCLLSLRCDWETASTGKCSNIFRFYYKSGLQTPPTRKDIALLGLIGSLVGALCKRDIFDLW